MICISSLLAQCVRPLDEFYDDHPPPDLISFSGTAPARPDSTSTAQPHDFAERTAHQQFGPEPSLQNPVRIPHIELFGRPSEQIHFGREREQPVSVGIAGKK